MGVFIVEIFLPLERPDGSTQPNDRYNLTRLELLEKFRGVTIYSRAPGEGLWGDRNEVVHDEIVVFETVDRDFDAEWWTGYKETLVSRFEQREIMLRAVEATLL